MKIFRHLSSPEKINELQNIACQNFFNYQLGAKAFFFKIFHIQTIRINNIFQINLIHSMKIKLDFQI